MAADDSGRPACMSVVIRLLRLVLAGALATLTFTFWPLADVAHACDPDIEDCEEEEEDPPETSPPHTSPPHTNPPQTSPPHTSPPATRPPATHAPATQPAIGKTATTAGSRQHTQTTRRRQSGQSGQSGTPTAPAEPFLDIPVAPVDTGVQLPAVQLAGDAKAAPGAGAAVDAGLPPETSAGGDADPKLALALAAAGIALLGAPLLTRQRCDEAMAAAARAEITAACAALATAKADMERAHASHAQALAAIARLDGVATAMRQAHAGLDAIHAARNRGLSIGGTARLFPAHPVDEIARQMATGDFDAALARAHADIDAQLNAAGDLSALEAARDAAMVAAIAAEGRHAAAEVALRTAQARWVGTCGPVPGCAS